MNEVDMQALVVKAVIASGGRAMKMSQEYVKGVADLLIKLPNVPALFLEAKRKDLSQKSLDDSSFKFELEATKLQKDFLRDWRKAGCYVGILSFLQLKGGNVNSLRMRVYSYNTCEAMGYIAHVRDHKELGKADTREQTILRILREEVF